MSSHPDLAEVVPFPRRELSRWLSPRTWGPIRAYLRSLRERHYDLVVDCQGLARSGIFAAATGAPRRVGLANAAELGWLGLTEGVHAPREMHAVDRMLLVAKAATGVEPSRDARLYSAKPDREHVREQLGLRPGSFVLLAPTTRWPAKLWPAERFVELARRLLDERATEHIAFVGAGSEGDQCAELRALASRDPRVTDLVGRTSVGQLLATVEAASLVIASDSAVLHMAVGFGRPLVGLFGPTHVHRVGPFMREADVIQHVLPGDQLDHKDAALGRAIMERITVDEVLEAARTRLSHVESPSDPDEATPGSAAHLRAVVTSPSSPATPSRG